jgi:hypothetical protein
MRGMGSSKDQWPGAAGPGGNHKVSNRRVPLTWSVSKNHHICWRTTLPETGQSGIAVWEDRVFLTTMHPVGEKDKKEGADIVGYCLEASTGKILWRLPLACEVIGTGENNESPYAYSFSDSSSPTPVTDGEFVWFVNASGRITCADFSGRVRWERVWKPTIGRPFNKQFEPILQGDWLLNVEPLATENPKREKDPWNYIHALDKRTGAVVWVAEDALTHYNTPMIGRGKQGLAILQGRGGYHDVPETPIGLSLTSLERKTAGKTLSMSCTGIKSTPTGLIKTAQRTRFWRRQRARYYAHNRSHRTPIGDVGSRVKISMSSRKTWTLKSVASRSFRRGSRISPSRHGTTSCVSRTPNPPMALVPAARCTVWDACIKRRER